MLECLLSPWVQRMWNTLFSRTLRLHFIAATLTYISDEVNNEHNSLEYVQRSAPPRYSSAPPKSFASSDFLVLTHDPPIEVVVGPSANSSHDFFPNGSSSSEEDCIEKLSTISVSLKQTPSTSRSFSHSQISDKPKQDFLESCDLRHASQSSSSFYQSKQSDIVPNESNTYPYGAIPDLPPAGNNSPNERRFLSSEKTEKGLQSCVAPHLGSVEDESFDIHQTSHLPKKMVRRTGLVHGSSKERRTPVVRSEQPQGSDVAMKRRRIGQCSPVERRKSTKKNRDQQCSTRNESILKIPHDVHREFIPSIELNELESSHLKRFSRNDDPSWMHFRNEYVKHKNQSNNSSRSQSSEQNSSEFKVKRKDDYTISCSEPNNENCDIYQETLNLNAKNGLQIKRGMSPDRKAKNVSKRQSEDSSNQNKPNLSMSQFELISQAQYVDVRKLNHE